MVILRQRYYNIKYMSNKFNMLLQILGSMFFSAPPRLRASYFFLESISSIHLQANNPIFSQSLKIILFFSASLRLCARYFICQPIIQIPINLPQPSFRFLKSIRGRKKNQNCEGLISTYPIIGRKGYDRELGLLKQKPRPPHMKSRCDQNNRPGLAGWSARQFIGDSACIPPRQG